ncbi:MAG: HAMP domain-containing protein, partial [Chloroflexi bacterium]|nr:HAMP domain-containing protein [Chloroflexota bacterium]
MAYTALLVASLGASSIYLVGFVRGTYLDQLHERVEQEARLIGQAALPFLGERDDPEELQRVVDRSAEAVAARVTIIAPDGRVVADSAQDAALMENHRNRAEVAQAIEQGIGSAQRVSVSVGTPLDYTALRLVDDGRTVGVVRLAVSQDEVDRNLRRIMSTVAIVGMVVSLLAMGLGALLVRRTVRSVRTVTEGARRLGAGDLDHRVRAEALDETDELARTFNIMADRLRSTVNDLSAQRNTLSAVLDTMTDGVVLVDGTGQLEVANAAARQLLALDPRQATRSDFMSVIRDHDLGRLIQVCRATAVRQQADIELPFGHGYLYAVATPLADVGNGGILLMIHDLTELRRIDVTRREFVSNVSHELRTPIASIKAMAETLGGAALA